MNVLCETSPLKVAPGWLYLETRDGEKKIKCDRIIARMGSSPPRKFVEECGIQFTSDDKRRLSPAIARVRDHGPRHLRDRRALAGYP